MNKLLLSIMGGLSLALAALYLTDTIRATPRQWPSSVQRLDLPVPSILKPTLAAAGGILGSPVCGPDSSLYFRRVPAAGSALETPVSRISPDGSETEIDLGKVPNAGGKLYVMSFTIDKAGEIYSILRSENDGREYLVAYDPVGRYQWSNPLAVSLRPSFLLKVATGRFLVGGMTITRSDAAPTPVISLIEKSGAVYRSLVQTGDNQSASRTVSGSFFNPAIELGSAAVGQDGSVYLFKPNSYPVIQTLTADGETTRVLQLIPPADQSQAADFFLDGQTAGVLYQRQLEPEGGKSKAELLLALYGAEDGRPKALYVQSAPGILACLRNRELTILSTSVDRHFVVGSVALP